MNILKLFQKSIYRLDKKEIFLVGFYASFMLVMTLAAFLDFIIGNYIDTYVEVFFILLTLLSIWYYKKSRNVDIAVYNIVVIATLTTYALLVSNDFNLSIFHSIVPLGYFLLFSLTRSLFYTFIHQIIVISIYVYGYYTYPDNITLHNSATLVAIIMASLMIILFGIVYHLAIENSYVQLQNADRQKELLLKEVHHRVKNNLNIISSMLGLQVLREKDDTIKQAFEKNRLRIDSIAMVHEILYKHSDFEKINIYEYLHQLSIMVVEMSDTNTVVRIKEDKLLLPFETVLKIGIITNELMVNSIKHAFENKSGEIKIEFEEYDDKYLYRYRDSNTRNIDIKQLMDGKSLGLKLIDMMVEQMEAKIEVDNKTGLEYTIRIPKNVH